jgi:hypothetical protein
MSFYHIKKSTLHLIESDTPMLDWKHMEQRHNKEVFLELTVEYTVG